MNELLLLWLTKTSRGPMKLLFCKKGNTQGEKEEVSQTVRPFFMDLCQHPLMLWPCHGLVDESPDAGKEAQTQVKKPNESIAKTKKKKHHMKKKKNQGTKAQGEHTKQPTLNTDSQLK